MPERSKAPGAAASHETRITQPAAPAAVPLSNHALAEHMLQRQPHPAPVPGNQPVPAPAPGAGSELAQYTDSMRERRAYQTRIFEKDPHAPSTGRGLFGAELGIGTLAITIRCSFDFEDASFWEYPNAPDEETEWQPGEADRWKATFMAQVRSVWSGQHTFHCQRDWWESEFANTDIEVVESAENPHFACTVQKIPPKEFRTSSVSSPIFGGALGGGTADFDSNDINSVPKAGGDQRASVHEAGHMLGLDDEYGDPDEEVEHSDIVEDQGGGKVIRGADGRIMSGGEQVGTAHGSTFLEVLKEITHVDWGNTPKPPRPVPPGGDGPMGDFPTPPRRGPGSSAAA
jgi:hypothetical protein